MLYFVPDSVTQRGRDLQLGNVVNLLEENEIFAETNPGKHNKTKQKNALCMIMKVLCSKHFKTYLKE